ncbi:MAG TPA: hypothetical protein VLZ72_03425 [Flavobacterium sp.]|nr:hypothetical protein [Flavobacterium sp.]
MLFQKVNSVLLALYLLASTSGLAFNVHYCEGEIASITSIFSLEEPCEIKPPQIEKSCCQIEDDSHDSCCSDETLQADTGEVVLKQVYFDFDYFALILTSIQNIFSSEETLYENNTTLYYCDANAPPLYLLYSQYIFYA